MENSKLTLGSLFDGSGGFPLGGLLSGITPVWLSEIEPFPIRVTSKRMPWIKNYGDVSKMDGGKVEPVDIITFGSPCFPAGTLVLTDKGMKEIEKICVGDRVLTHKGRWRKVTATGSKAAPTIRLKGQHYGLVCTENHPIYNLEGCEYKWTEASEMKGKLWGVPNKTEYLPIPLPTQIDRKTKPMPEISEGFFYFVGRWLGDGWVRDGQRSGRPAGQCFATIYLCDSADKLDELKDTLSCISARYSVEHNETCVKVRCNSRLLCDWLVENFGKYAWAKEIPSWALSMKEEYRIALLRGILDSDGYKKKTSCKITTVSKKLAFGVRLLAESLGYTTTVYFCKRPGHCQIEGRTVNQRDTYSVEIFNKGSRISDDRISWYRVKSVTPEKKTDIVYNLTVDEDNSYTADSIVVHNCQDMSVAGKRSGLDGERSSLFYEAVRIIKEMRKATDGRYPRWAVWENVPGAFSSSNGEDFRCVLESLCGVKYESISVPKPKKWLSAGSIVGDGFSLAWRVLDAQYWGVPQRRKRIYLVADFTGGSAGKILFESESLSGYSEKSRISREEASGCAEECTGAAGCDEYNGDLTGEVSSTLGVNCGMSTGRNGVVQFLFENHGQAIRYRGPLDVSPTLTANLKGGNNQPFVTEQPLTMKIRCGKEGGGKGALIQTDKSATLATNNDQTLFEPCSWDGKQVSPTLTKQNAGGSQRMPDKDNFNCVIQPVTGPLCASGYDKLGTQEAKSGMYVVQPFGISSKDSNAMKSSNPNSGIYEAETSRTLDGNGGNPSCNQGGIAVVETVAIEGNGTRPSHKGDGYSESDVEYTLNGTEVHGVAYSITTGSSPNVSEEKAPPLLARDFKDATVVTEPAYGIGRDAFNQGANAQYKPAIEEELQPTIVAKGPGAVAHPYGFYPQMKAECVTMTEDKSVTLVNGTNPGYQNGVVEPTYAVRRLTPTECARLQGFPDWWCSGLETEKPADEDMYFWYKVFKTYSDATGAKMKTDNQIRKWLNSPYSDSNEYKMWGNGVALPCVVFVLSGLVYYYRNGC